MNIKYRIYRIDAKQGLYALHTAADEAEALEWLKLQTNSEHLAHLRIGVEYTILPVYTVA